MGGSTGSGWDATTTCVSTGSGLLPRKRGHPHVDPTVIGGAVDLTADLGSRVEVRLDGHLVAAHDRAWARGRTVTERHGAAAKVLRVSSTRPPASVPGSREELTRNLADYDQAFGLLDTLTEGEVA